MQRLSKAQEDSVSAYVQDVKLVCSEVVHCDKRNIQDDFIPLIATCWIDFVKFSLLNLLSISFTTQALMNIVCHSGEVDRTDVILRCG